MDQVPQGPVVSNIAPKQPEQIVLSVRKHLFGLVVLYIEALIGIIAVFALFAFLVPSLAGSSNKSQVYGIGSIALVLVLGLTGLVLAAATFIYRRSQLVVTLTNITQVNQVGLFNRKISKLSLADVEDVSAQQKGIFASIFRYGTVFVETAGEQSNFHFDYCPNPNAVAKRISDCEQAFNQNPGQPNGP